MRKILSVLACVLVPAVAEAAVYVNEIAWMGGADDANAEWIELLNSGASSVDLSGWTLVASDGSPTITLSGSIAGGGLYLLERTDDDSVAGVTADQFYTGALGNGGEILTLMNASGAAVDTVTGGTNWANVGGDNATKQTAQRTASGWTTASLTPRAANANGIPHESIPPPEENEPEAPTSPVAPPPPSGGGGGPMEVLTPPRYLIEMDIPERVTAGAETTFTAAVYDDAGRRRDDSSITWSFGDGTKRVGASVLHTFYDEGEYAVTVRAEVNGGRKTETFTVVATFAGIRIIGSTERGIALLNESDAPLDLSFWRLSAGGQEFKLPEDTFILPKRTVVFSPKVTGLPVTGAPLLLYPSGEVAATYPSRSLPPPPPQPPVDPTRSQETNAVGAIISSEEAYEEEVTAPAGSAEALPAGAVFAGASGLSRLLSSSWTLAFLALLVFSGGALMLVRRHG